MAVPKTTREFVAFLGQSGIVDEKALKAYLHQRGSVLSDNPARAATQLVKDGVLTQFQAAQLLKGKYKGFFLGRYKVLEQIGVGGMAAVYLCEHTHLRRKVAVKVLPAPLAADASYRERFYREARALAVLDHPNVVRAFDVAEEQGKHFLAMEYVEGTSLQEIVVRRGPLPTIQVVQYMRQAALGLQHAFEAGLVHRDIKPGNLLIDLSGTVKILDLGLARFFEDETDDLSLRHDDKVLGTADYLAPESAIDCRQADTRSDIYGLGCTFYFCLTGRPPFPEGTMTRKLIFHQTMAPTPLRKLRPDLPAEVAAVLEKAMAKRPEDRYQTPADLARALGELPILSSETSTSAGAQTMKHRTKARIPWWRRAARVVAGLIAGSFRLLWRRRQAPVDLPPNPPGQTCTRPGKATQRLSRDDSEFLTL